MSRRVFRGTIEDIFDDELTFVAIRRASDRRIVDVAINDDQAMELKPYMGDEVKVWTTGLADSTERLVRFEF